MTHICYVPFTGLGLQNGCRGDDWLKNRIKIFKKYTLKSLQNQTNKNYILWLSFRQEEKENPIVIEFGKYIENTKIEAVFTFEGIMFRDDKFSADHERNNTLLQRMSNVMKGWESLVDDWIYMTRLDSDDMLSKTAVEEIQNQEPFEGALIYQNGYIYNSITDELAEWNPNTCPPFYTLIFKRDTFLDAKKHLEFMGDWKTHEETIQFPHKYLSDKQYCVTIHGHHISTNWDHRFRGKIIEGERKNFPLPEKNELTLTCGSCGRKLFTISGNSLKDILKNVNC